MNIYLVRHAQKDTSIKHKKKDDYDRDLTEVGLKQAKELAKYLISYSITKIFSSDMLRAIRTAEIIASYLNLPNIVKNRNLREIDPCIMPNHPDKDKIKLQCLKDWNFKTKLGESYNESKKRFSDYFWSEIAKYHDKENILVVGHAQVIKLFLSDFLKNGRNIIKEPYSYAAITHLKINKKNMKLKVLVYNDNSFLPKLINNY